MRKKDDEQDNSVTGSVVAHPPSPEIDLTIHPIRRGVEACGGLGRKDRSEIYGERDECANDCQRNKDGHEFLHCIR